MENYCNSDSKVILRFSHQCWSEYENEDENINETLQTTYQASTWQDACLTAADDWDWDDEEVLNFEAESDLMETGRDLIHIEYLDLNNEWKKVSNEVIDYFNEVEEKAMNA